MDNSTREIRLTRWKQIIEQCQNREEGQTAKQWMADNQVSEKSYYYWLRKIRREAYGQLDNPASVPAVQHNSSITFTEMPAYAQNTEELSFNFQAAAVIKTTKATVALADTISDHLLNRILREVGDA